MVRTLTLILAIGVLCIPGSVMALGVGNIHLRSALDQAFDAEIDLLSVKPDELDGVKVKLASPEAFDRTGTDRPYFLTKLRFKPSLNTAGKAVIHVTSHAAMREPFLNFLIEVNWAKGRLVREYTVLLDPPVTLKHLPPPVAAPVIRPQAALTSPPIFTPGMIESQPLVEDYPVSYEEKSAPILSNYGPVQKNQTLWRIAMDTKPAGVTVQQMIMALQRSNPYAFYEENVNNLKRGVILRIPTREEIDYISVREAQTRFSTQVDQWTEEHAAAPDSAVGSGIEPVDEKEPVGGEVAPVDDKLELASASPEDAGITGTDDAEREAKAIARMENSLELAREENESAKQEQTELLAQVSELESQLADIEQVLELRNDQLARIQAEAAKNKAEESLAEPGLGESEVELELAEMEPEPEFAGVEPEAEETPAKVQEDEAQSISAPQVDAAVQPDRAKSADKDILSFIREQLEQNLIAVAGVGLVVLLVLLMLRRRQQSDEDDKFQEEFFVTGDTKDTETADTVVDEDTEASLSQDEEVSLLSEFSHSEMDDVQDDTGEVDPVAEADVYIAYGRYQQAEELLQQAMQHNPDKLNSHFKLLEIFFATKDVEGFTALAEELHGKDAETRDADAWKQAQAMGHNLNPGHFLFANVSAADALAVSEPVDEMVDSSSDIPTDDGDLGLPDMDDLATDFDLNEEPGEQNQQPVVDEDSLDFNLDFGGEEAVENEVSPSLKMDGIGEEDGSPEAMALSADGEETATPGEPDESDELGEDLLGLSGLDLENLGDEVASLDAVENEVDVDSFVSGAEDLAGALSDFTAEPVQAKADDGLEDSVEGKVQDTSAMARELEESLSAFTVDQDAGVKGDEDVLGGEVEAASIEVPTLSLDDLEEIDDIELGAEIEESGDEEPSLSLDDPSDLGTSEAEMEIEELGDEKPSLSMDDDLSDLVVGDEAEALSEDLPSTSMEDLDDLDEVDISDLVDLDSFGVTEEVLSELPELPEESDVEADLFTELSDEVGGTDDEVATKLDLARAYVEMGDEEGARGILDEVISEGSDTQKEEGQELLKGLS